MRSTSIIVRQLVFALGLVIHCGGSSAAPADPAADYPSKPVRFIVPFTPGAGTDITVRLVTTALTDLWGKTMLVDNRAGAGGNIGTEITATAVPDVHQHGFAPQIGERRGDQTHRDVGSRARRKWHDETHRLRGIVRLVG